MTKYKLTTTLRMLKANKTCKAGYKKLRQHLGRRYKLDTEINLLDVLNSNGVNYTLWCFRAAKGIVNKPLRLIVADFAESVLHLISDNNARNLAENAIKLCRDFNVDDRCLILASRAACPDSYASLSSAHAANAAYYGDAPFASCAADFASDAAANAVQAASRAAAPEDHAAARAAAEAHAEISERKKQAEIIKKYLTY